MLNLIELEQLIAFADYGTLSKVAEIFNISQPTITRTMQHVEESFGVSLFSRGKNKITLNKTGLKAVKYARTLLSNAENTIIQVQQFDKSLHTIVIDSCAPSPLWFLLPVLSSEFQGITVSSGIKDISEITRNINSDNTDIGVIPYMYEQDDLNCLPILKESLSLAVPLSHTLAFNDHLTFKEMNGFNFLLRSEIGFWDELCRKKLPASKFLVQKEDFAFKELIRESSLPCFTTNLVSDTAQLLRDRKIIPITDSDANVTYHILFLKKKRQLDSLLKIRCT